MADNPKWGAVDPSKTLEQLRTLSKGIRGISKSQFRAEAERLKAWVEAARKKRAADAWARRK